MTNPALVWGWDAFPACDTPACDVQVMRRNIMSTALHGSGLYQFDLRLGGWFGHADAAPKTLALWAAIASARRAVERAFNASSAQDQGAGAALLRPEVAVLYDDASLGYLRADGVGTLDATVHPAEWLNDLQGYAASLGTPVRAVQCTPAFASNAWLELS
jgi:hypothetical protein